MILYDIIVVNRISGRIIPYMPLRLEYYDRSYVVAPVLLEDGSLGLSIDGRNVRVNPDVLQKLV